MTLRGHGDRHVGTGDIRQSDNCRTCPVLFRCWFCVIILCRRPILVLELFIRHAAFLCWFVCVVDVENLFVIGRFKYMYRPLSQMHWEPLRILYCTELYIVEDRCTKPVIRQHKYSVQLSRNGRVCITICLVLFVDPSKFVITKYNKKLSHRRDNARYDDVYWTVKRSFEVTQGHPLLCQSTSY